jgi:hypothetical protein
MPKQTNASNYVHTTQPKSHVLLPLFLLFDVLRRLQLLPTLTLLPTTRRPHLAQLLLNLPPSNLPLLNPIQPIPQLRQLLLDTVLLARSPDPQELVLVCFLSQAEGEGVGVVAFEGGAGGDGDES